MKHIIISVLLLISLTAQAQRPVLPAKPPTTATTANNYDGWHGVDTALYFRTSRDTNFTPLAGTYPIVFWKHAGVDTLHWSWNGAKWYKIEGSGTFFPFPSGTTAEYIRGNGTLATFPTLLSQFTNDIPFATQTSVTALTWQDILNHTNGGVFTSSNTVSFNNHNLTFTGGSGGADSFRVNTGANAGSLIDLRASHILGIGNEIAFNSATTTFNSSAGLYVGGGTVLELDNPSGYYMRANDGGSLHSISMIGNMLNNNLKIRNLNTNDTVANLSDLPTLVPSIGGWTYLNPNVKATNASDSVMIGGSTPVDRLTVSNGGISVNGGNITLGHSFGIARQGTLQTGLYFKDGYPYIMDLYNTNSGPALAIRTTQGNVIIGAQPTNDTLSPYSLWGRGAVNHFDSLVYAGSMQTNWQNYLTQSAATPLPASGNVVYDSAGLNYVNSSGAGIRLSKTLFTAGQRFVDSFPAISGMFGIDTYANNWYNFNYFKNNVGFGSLPTTNPISLLDVEENSTTPIRGITNGQNNNSTTAPRMNFLKSRNGGLITTGDSLLLISGRGLDGLNNGIIAGSITLTSKGVISNGSIGGEFAFSTRNPTTGIVQDGLRIDTSQFAIVPVALSLPASARTQGEYLYNVDGVNYERKHEYWSGNVFNLAIENAGSGSNRDMIIGNGSALFTIASNPTSPNGFFNFTRSTTNVAPIYSLQVTRSNSAGVGLTFYQSGIYTQTGSAGSTDFTMNRIEIGLGSGVHKFMDLQVSGTSLVSIANTGLISQTATITAIGTTGNQTINKPLGTVNIAAAGTSVTVTNSLATANSLIFANIYTNDATATGIKSIVRSAGSFIITLNAAATGTVVIGFSVEGNL